MAFLLAPASGITGEGRGAQALRAKNEAMTGGRRRATGRREGFASAARCCTGVIFARQRPLWRNEIRFFVGAFALGAQPSMATKTGKDLEDLRALLAEVQALRDDIEKKGAELRSDWGPAAEQAASRATNLSNYIALRSHDLTELQLRLAARGLSSLGRSEAKVAATLDALIVTLRRLTGETDVPYPAAAVARASASEVEAEADRLFGKRSRGAPRVRVMATLPPEAATQAELVDNLIAAGMDCARINCAHDDP